MTPHPVDIEYPGLLEESFRLLGYPLATVLAEKVVTMIQRGVTTTRERDFADVLLLSGRHPIDALELLAALRATADHRQAILRPLAGLLEGLGDDRQRSWTTFTTSVGLVGLMPTDYSEVIAAVAAYVDPLLGGSITTGRWDPETRRWAEEERP